MSDIPQGLAAEDTLDEGFQPVPQLTDPPDPQDELDLLDELQDDQPAKTAVTPVPLGRAPAYDFIERAFLPAPAGGQLVTRGVGTLKTWVEKCVRTRRGENAACDPGFGLDVIGEDILDGDAYDASIIGLYTAALERGLTYHPRISAVEQITVDYPNPDDDAVTVTFTVVPNGDDLDPFTLTLDLAGGA